tara:strand:+ start:1017 stop:1241 length:225 start_codon:yes stop_codon:yes gene_type:complete
MMTRGGLKKEHLKVSIHTGKIVSKRASLASMRKFADNGRMNANRNIGNRYRGAKKTEEVRDVEDLDWNMLLNDV